VIDSPAILPTGVAAPQIECADRAVLVVEWDRTERQAIMEARDMLGPDAKKIIGAVLNKASPSWSRLFNYGGYVKYALDLKAAA
jgi:Mrp family chromosome partitioning ATPase